MAMVEKNKQYQVLIEGYASDGSGVTHIEGMAVFVKNALRGELVDVLIEHVGHQAAWGRTVKVLHPSPARQKSDCPYYNQCGSCQFRHMSYTEELEAKGLRVKDALARIGGLDLSLSWVWGAEEIIRYRNKVQLPVSGQSIGYYKARSHQVVDIEDCLLQPERAALCCRAVKEWMNKYQISAYEERTQTGLVRHVYLRFNQAGETLCCIIVNGKNIPHPEQLVELLRRADSGLVGVVLNINIKKTNVILGSEYITLWGRDWLEETLCGLSFRLSVPSFFQVNQTQTETLYRRAVELAGLTGRETVLDLYCGIGSIALCMAGRARRVIGAEIVPQAVADAKDNAKRNGIENVEFFCGDAAKIASQLRVEGLRPDVITVDPPRKGLSPEVPEILAEMNPARIVYVSCDPATLARDLRRLEDLGYQAIQVEAVDLFPRTAHVETVVLLSKKLRMIQ